MLCSLHFIVLAQKTEDSKSNYSVSGVMEIMRSTHSNAFYGPSLRVNRLFGNHWEPGIGIEYAATPIHHDNGFILRKLKFLPVYGNLKYNFSGAKQITFFAETSLGISFNRYNIADDRTPTEAKPVREEGFYTYLGGGVKYHLAKSFDIFAGIGLKGYKMSTNDLDINPHGLSFLLGFSI